MELSRIEEAFWTRGETFSNKIVENLVTVDLIYTDTLLAVVVAWTPVQPETFPQGSVPHLPPVQLKHRKPEFVVIVTYT